MHDIDVELRPATPDDIAGITALIRACDAFDGIPRVQDEGELRDELSASYIDFAEDVRVATGANGDRPIVGWAFVWNPPAEGRRDRAELRGDVHPDHRRRGIGTALLRWSAERAAARLRARDHDLPRVIRVYAYEQLDDRHRLYRRQGFEPVRWHDELLRPLDGLPPRRTPEGIALVPWDEARDEEVRSVRNTAFADHWGSMAVGPELWREFVYGHGGRTDLSTLAVDTATGAVVGVCINHVYPEDEQVTGRKEGWIANICTLREHRGRGIASAMLVWSLHAFAAAGLDHAILDVDSENPTGANRLYRGLGFAPHQRSITYEVDVPGDVSASESAGA